MCMHDHDQVSAVPPREISRRNVFAGAAIMAGIATVGVGAAGPAAASPSGSSGTPNAPRYHGRPIVPGPLILLGGALVDPLNGSIVEDGVVVMHDGRVLASGTRDQTRRAIARLSARARVLDVEGRWIVPGLVDAHVHNNALTDAVAVLHGGATTTRSGSSNFYQDVALRALPEWAPGRVPRMHAAGVFVTPELGDTVLADPSLAPLVTVEGGIRSTQDLAYLTRVNLSRGVDVIKTRANPRAGLADQDPTELVYDREQISAIVKAARGAGVLCHAYSEVGIDGAVRAGVRSIEHGVFMSEATMERMARRGTFFTPTMSTIFNLLTAEDPVLRARGEEYVPVLRAAVAEAHSRGVTVVAGTDSFGNVVDPIGREVRLLAEAGLSPLEALRSATTHAARLLKRGKLVGRLAPGYYADAVVVARNPLEDASALEQVEVVVAQGVVARNEL